MVAQLGFVDVERRVEAWRCVDGMRAARLPLSRAAKVIELLAGGACSLAFANLSLWQYPRGCWGMTKHAPTHSLNP